MVANFAPSSVVFVSAGFSDRLSARRPFMLVGCALAIIGFVALIAAKQPVVINGGTFLVAA
jgi:hypothetical protein